LAVGDDGFVRGEGALAEHFFQFIVRFQAQVAGADLSLFG